MNAHTDTYWQKLGSIGWLDYLTEDEQEVVREQLEINLADEDSWWCAHAALAKTGFEDDSPEEILCELARMFAPGKMLCGVCGGIGWLPG